MRVPISSAVLWSTHLVLGAFNVIAAADQGSAQLMGGSLSLQGALDLTPSTTNTGRAW